MYPTSFKQNKEENPADLNDLFLLLFFVLLDYRIKVVFVYLFSQTQFDYSSFLERYDEFDR